MNTATRYAIHPDQYRVLSTEELRTHFLIESIFVKDTVQLAYTHYDRMIAGGAAPVEKTLPLETFNDLKSATFLERRELGIINVGDEGSVIADGTSYTLGNKEALYIGRGCNEVLFKSHQKNSPALFYFNSAPAHKAYPTKKVAFSDAQTVTMGENSLSNERKIHKLLVDGVISTCQLQMGLTVLKTGSNWNTMPPHTHDRRMEVYFYFDLEPGNAVCHFMGPPDETRHIWLQNHQAVISPPWSIHSGVGTSNYAFIWGMAGENLDYGDMDHVKPTELK